MGRCREKTEFNRILEERMDDIGKCELCGSKRGLELHHCIPVSCGGDDSDENLILICQTCHVKLTPKKLLTKLGIKRAREDGKQIGRRVGKAERFKKDGTETKTFIKGQEIKEKIKKYAKAFGGEIDDNTLIKEIGISRATYYKYKKEIKQQGE